jgi:IclR family pca regulon transcriptional regulator
MSSQARDDAASSDGKPRYSISLELGAAILGCFSSERPTLGAVEIADMLGMGRARVHRYMVTLRELGYLERTTHRRNRLTFGITKLGMSTLSALSLSEHAQPHLQELRKRTSFTSSIAILDGDEVLLEEIEPVMDAAPFSPERLLVSGARLPLHCTALGKTLLAHLPNYVRAALLGEIVLQACTPNTITSRLRLEDELENVRLEQIGLEDEEYRLGLVSIAAPVLDHSGEIAAAVSLLASSDVITAEKLARELAPLLLTTTNHISACLGYIPEDERE